jgi:chromosome segregation ATPase
VDAKSSLSDAKSSLGDAKSLLGDAKRSLGDAESSLGEVQAAAEAAETAAAALDVSHRSVAERLQGAERSHAAALETQRSDAAAAAGEAEVIVALERKPGTFTESLHMTKFGLGLGLGLGNRNS